MLGQLQKRGISLHMIDLGGDVTGNGISKLVFTILSEKMLLRLPAGTTARIDAVLGPIEDRSDFVRAAIERELKRRERAAA